MSCQNCGLSFDSPDFCYVCEPLKSKASYPARLTSSELDDLAAVIDIANSFVEDWEMHEARDDKDSAVDCAKQRAIVDRARTTINRAKGIKQ